MTSIFQLGTSAPTASHSEIKAGYFSSHCIANAGFENTHTAGTAITDRIINLDRIIDAGISAETPRRRDPLPAPDATTDLGSFLATVPEPQLTRLYNLLCENRSRTGLRNGVESLFQSSFPPGSRMLPSAPIVNEIVRAPGQTQRITAEQLKRYELGQFPNFEGSIIKRPSYLRRLEHDFLVTPALEWCVNRFLPGTPTEPRGLLDVGAWDGRLSQALAPHFSNFTGIEPSSARFAQLQESFRRLELQVQRDGSRPQTHLLNLDVLSAIEGGQVPIASHDMVLFSQLLYFLRYEEDECALRWAMSRLRSGGVTAVILNDMAPDPGSRAHLRRFMVERENNPNPERYHELLSRYAKVVEVYRPALHLQSSTEVGLAATRDLITYLIPGAARYNTSRIDDYINRFVLNRGGPGVHRFSHRLYVLVAQRDERPIRVGWNPKEPVLTPHSGQRIAPAARAPEPDNEVIDFRSWLTDGACTHVLGSAAGDVNSVTGVKGDNSKAIAAALLAETPFSTRELYDSDRGKIAALLFRPLVHPILEAHMKQFPGDNLTLVSHRARVGLLHGLAKLAFDTSDAQASLIRDISDALWRDIPIRSHQLMHELAVRPADGAIECYEGIPGSSCERLLAQLLELDPDLGLVFEARFSRGLFPLQGAAECGLTLRRFNKCVQLISEYIGLDGISSETLRLSSGAAPESAAPSEMPPLDQSDDAKQPEDPNPDLDDPTLLQRLAASESSESLDHYECPEINAAKDPVAFLIKELIEKYPVLPHETQLDIGRQLQSHRMAWRTALLENPVPQHFLIRALKYASTTAHSFRDCFHGKFYERPDVIRAEVLTAREQAEIHFRRGLRFSRAWEQTAGGSLKKLLVEHARRERGACAEVLKSILPRDQALHEGESALRRIVSQVSIPAAPDRTALRIRAFERFFGCPLSDAEHLLRELDVNRQAWEESRSKLVAHNARFVFSIIHMYFGGRRSDHALLEHFENGILGATHAADLWDPGRGLRFVTYAGHWIRQSIQREIYESGSAVRVPVHVSELRRSLNRAILDYTSDHAGKKPTTAELAQALQMSEKSVEIYHGALTRRITSLDAPQSSKSEDSFAEVLAERGHSHFESADRMYAAELRDAVICAFRSLTRRERTILSLRFGLGIVESPNSELGIDWNHRTGALTLEEIGSRMGISRERVRQLESKALAKLVNFEHPLRQKLIPFFRELLDTPDFGAEFQTGGNVPRSPAFDFPVSELSLSVREVNGLESAGIYILEDLLDWTAEELLTISNTGVETLAKIERAISAHGCRLPSTPTEVPASD